MFLGSQEEARSAQRSKPATVESKRISRSAMRALSGGSTPQNPIKFNAKLYTSQPVFKQHKMSQKSVESYKGSSRGSQSGYNLRPNPPTTALLDQASLP